MQNLKSKPYLVLGIIILIGIFLRFFLLTKFPVQLNHDEITQLYDAISIAQTGKDIYGNFMPFIFPSIHDFKPPFYTYATTLAYFIFGNREFIIRLPGALFGVLIIPAVFLFTNRLFKNKQIALIASFICAIAPFEIFFSRKSFENGAGIFFMLIGFFALFSFIKNKEKIIWLYGGVLSLSVGLYTYFSHAIIIPLLLFSFITIFKDEFKSNFRKYVFPFLLLVMLVIPLGFIILTNPDSRYRSQTVFITQDPILGKQIQNIGDNSLVSKLLIQKTTTEYAFNRYLDQFNPTYLFVDGLDFTNQALINIGPLMFVLLPFLLLGIIYVVRQENFSKEKKFILAWILIGTLPSGLTNEAHSPHRIIMVFTMMDILIACGLFYFINFFEKNRTWKKVVYLNLIFLICINFIYFIHMYFVNFPNEKSQYIHYPFKQVASLIASEYNNYQQIIFDPLFGESAPIIGTAAHYYVGYYGNIPPEKFQKEYKIGSREREVLIDKISIRKVDWSKDSDLKNTLLIASPWSIPIESIGKEKVIKTFYFYDGLPAFYAIKL